MPKKSTTCASPLRKFGRK